MSTRSAAGQRVCAHSNAAAPRAVELRRDAARISSRRWAVRSTRSTADAISGALALRVHDGVKVGERGESILCARRRQPCVACSWTRIDTDVACRSMGYEHGGFWRWYRRNNDTYPLVMPRPACRDEFSASLWECDGFADPTRIRLSENLCQGEDDLGLYCWGRPTFTGWARHWRGEARGRPHNRRCHSLLQASKSTARRSAMCRLIPTASRCSASQIRVSSLSTFFTAATTATRRT